MVQIDELNSIPRFYTLEGNWFPLINQLASRQPKFIPVYTELNGKWLSLMDKVLYWFIEFFLSNNEKFYCSNEQLAELLETTPVTISKSIKHLEELWYIVLNKKMKTWWWLIRLILWK